MPKKHFLNVDTWVFDLDNTLYPPSVRLFDQIEVRMTQYVMDSLGVDKSEADRLRQVYWRDYGTTLAGLMRVHDVDPGPYLTDVHDICFADLTPDPKLRAGIEALPGRKIVYTNGCRPYAENVLHHRGLGDLFDAVYGVEHAEFHPKPDRVAFEHIFARDGVTAERAAMFEDDPRNLAAPHAMGLRTVLVAPEPVEEPFIEHHTDDLPDFLSRLV